MAKLFLRFRDTIICILGKILNAIDLKFRDDTLLDVSQICKKFDDT